MTITNMASVIAEVEDVIASVKFDDGRDLIHVNDLHRHLEVPGEKLATALQKLEGQGKVERDDKLHMWRITIEEDER